MRSRFILNRLARGGRPNRVPSSQVDADSAPPAFGPTADCLSSVAESDAADFRNGGRMPTLSAIGETSDWGISGVTLKNSIVEIIEREESAAPQWEGTC